MAVPRRLVDEPFRRPFRAEDLARSLEALDHLLEAPAGDEIVLRRFSTPVGRADVGRHPCRLAGRRGPGFRVGHHVAPDCSPAVLSPAAERQFAGESASSSSTCLMCPALRVKSTSL